MRNYGFQFAYDDIGSSPDPCAANYRGPNAFSEPETSALRDFVTKWSNIKIAINMMSNGNLFVHPFNYDLAANTLLHSNFSSADLFYQNIFQLGGFPKSGASGNAGAIANNTMNGGPSDWMLAELNIYAMSPIIGISDSRS